MKGLIIITLTLSDYELIYGFSNAKNKKSYIRNFASLNNIPRLPVIEKLDSLGFNMGDFVYKTDNIKLKTTLEDTDKLNSIKKEAKEILKINKSSWFMGDNEIRCSFKYAKNRAYQIIVLSQLNMKPVNVIIDKLETLGFDMNMYRNMHLDSSYYL